MPTLVLSPRYSQESKALRVAAGRAGWKAYRLGGWRAPGHLRGQHVVLYGEATFAEVIAAQLGVALIDAPPTWLPGLPERHRRRRIEMSTLARVRGSRAWPVFVKPADGRKGFEGRVYRSPSDLPGEDDFAAGTPVFVGEPVVWEVEFRCHVLEGSVVAMSPYLREGELTVTDDGYWDAPSADTRAAREYAEELLADAEVPVPPAIVLDIGRIRGKGWAVVEANAAWGAGLYGCDPQAVLSVLARSCVPRTNLTETDQAWVVDEVELNGAGEAK